MKTKKFKENNDYFKFINKYKLNINVIKLNIKNGHIVLTYDII